MAKPVEAVDPHDISSILRACLREIRVPGDVPFWLPSGIDVVDWALGGRGWPSGRFVEIIGDTSTGKSAIALRAAVEMIKQGGQVVYIDAEGTWDWEWARINGVNKAMFEPVLPDNLEVVHSTIQGIVDYRATIQEPTLIVWDSIAGSLGQEGNDTDPSNLKDHYSPALEARLNSKFLAKSWFKAFRNSKIVLIAVNQLRAKIGYHEFGDTTPGGQALRYYTSIRARLDPEGPIKSGNDVIGQRYGFDIRKSKIAVKRSSLLMTYPGIGIDNVFSVLEVFTKTPFEKGGRILWGGKSYWKKDLHEAIKQDPALWAAVRAKAREIYFGQV